MALHEIRFAITREKAYESIPVEWSHSGVVGSGDMEVLMRRVENGGDVSVKIVTPVTGYDDVWEKVLRRFVAEAALGDVVIMSELGRIGLTGPEVIEQEMGKKEFDSTDRALIYRTTGGKHKAIMRDCAFLVADTIGAFYEQVKQLLEMPYRDLQQYRIIGTWALVREQLSLVELAVSLKPRDSMDVWQHFGNADPAAIPDMELSEFREKAKLRPRGEVW